MVALVAASSLLAPGPSAQAHTDLIRSSPAEGDRLETAPREIELEFSQDVDPDLATVVLSRAGSDPAQLEVDGGAKPAVLLATVPVGARSADEAWSVGYRVTSVDGHPIEGSVDFDVAGTGSASPDPDGGKPSEESDPGPHVADAGAVDSDDVGTGRVTWLYAGLAIAIGVLVMLGLARLAGRSAVTDAPPPSSPGGAP